MLAYKTGLSEEDKERIIQNFLPSIKYTAYRFAWRLPPQLTVDDLISVGIIGLLDALNRYREEEGKLTTFVDYRIRGAMLDELRTHDWLPKSIKKKIDSVKKAHQSLEKELGRMPEGEEIAASLNISLDEYYKILQQANMQTMLRFEDFSEMHDDNGLDMMECIADPDAKSPLEIVENNYKKEILASLINELPQKEKLILSLYYWEEMTMKEIGSVLNLTEGRVCQLHNQALMRLKATMEAHMVSTRDI